MNVDEVLQKLEALGKEQYRKIYRRHGVCDPLFGVNTADLERVRKEIKMDQSLAIALWSSSNHDARMLATKIADPLLLDEGMINQWVSDLQNYALADSLVDLLLQTPVARQLAEHFVDDDREYPCRVGWHLIAHLAMKDRALPNSYFEKYLDIIASDIHQRKNRIREAMNNALIAIGIRNDELEAKAIQVAGKVGKVEVDHGETNCKTPDAITYIHKARLHQLSRKLKKTKEQQ